MEITSTARPLGQWRAWHAEALASLGCAPCAPRVSDDALLPFATRIEHTLLKAGSTRDELRKLCDEARAHHFGAVCCLPCHVAQARAALTGTAVRVVTVAGFPLGAALKEALAAEVRLAAVQGADEIDIVADLGALREDRLRDVRDHIAAAVDAAALRPIKVILETGLLDDRQIAYGAAAAEAAGAAYVKTSTGFGPRGASLADVELFAAVVGGRLGIKAAGGIRERAFALALVAAGATRLGTSCGPALVEEP